MKDCLLNYSFEQLKTVITELGEKSFRAGQIFKALHLGLDFCEMTEHSKILRERLCEKFDSYVSNSQTKTKLDSSVVQ